MRDAPSPVAVSPVSLPESASARGQRRELGGGAPLLFATDGRPSGFPFAAWPESGPDIAAPLVAERHTAGHAEWFGHDLSQSYLSPANDFSCNVPAPAFSFHDDLHSFLPSLKNDTLAIANCRNGVFLGAALAASLGMRESLDGEVREATARHPRRWGEGSRVLGHLGEVQYQVPVLLAVYAHSLHRDDATLHDFSRSLINAYTLTGLSTVAIKGIANTDRPTDTWNNGEFGFPSFHVGSSMTIAAVVDEYYGPQWGLPSYVLAGLIGWSRIDERDHDLSDVVFGAALGYVIGKSVARYHREGDPRVRIWPYYQPGEASGGMMLEVPY